MKKLLERQHRQPSQMLKELLDIGNYPLLYLYRNKTFTEKLLTLLKTYGLVFVAVIMVAPFIMVTDYLATHVLHFKTIIQVDKNAMTKFFHRFGYWRALIYVGLLGPLLEETVFRLPLAFRKISLTFAAAALVFMSSGVLLIMVKSIFIKLTIRIFLTALIFLIGLKFIPAQIQITNELLRKRLIIISICLFGLIHISNYTPVQWPIIWLYPIYVLPQLAMGWAITYLRFKNGFVWGLGLHCLINSVSILIAFPHP